MKSAMQKLIEFITDTDGTPLQGCEYILLKATELLAKEKEQAKQEAIGFAEWCSNNQFTCYNDIWTSTNIHYMPDKRTTESLYKVYEEWKSTSPFYQQQKLKV